MRRMFLLPIVTAIFFTIIESCNGQWINTSGLYNRYINALAVSGQNLIAGTSAGPFLSTDNGKSWSLPDSSSENFSVMCLAVGTSGGTGRNLFVGTYQGNVFLSRNDGVSWIESDSGILDAQVNALAVNGPDIFAGAHLGIYRSTNEGRTWEMTDTADSAKSVVRSLAVISAGVGTRVFAGTEYAGLLVSADSGASWSRADSGLGNRVVSSLVESGTNVFAGTDSGIFLSTDYGVSWSNANTGIGNLVINTLAAVGADVFAGTDSGVFRSSDNGETWSAVNSKLPDLEIISSFANGADLYIGTGGGGVFSTADHGANWDSANSGIDNPFIYSLGTIGKSLLAGTSNSIILSSDDGANWSKIESVDTMVSCFTSDDFTIFAGTQGGGILKSTDDGESWIRSDSGLKSLTVYSLAVAESSVFAGTDSGVFRSTNEGLDWSLANSGRFEAAPTTALCVVGADIFAGTNSGGIFRSTDNGQDWTLWNLGIALPCEVYSFAEVDTNLFAVTNYGLYHLIGNESSWTHINVGGTVSCIAASGRGIFAGGLRATIYLSTDYGSHWTNVSSGLSPSNLAPIKSIAALDSNLFVGAWSTGVWRRPLSDMITTDIVAWKVGLPEQFSLSQNYPNPFNPSTVINYQLPVISHVTLEIYDVLGRVVRTLVDSRELAGSYSVKFDASSLPSGVYFYRLLAGRYTKTMKLMVLK